MKAEDFINKQIQFEGVNPNLISDGHHTFEELYKQRRELFIILCRFIHMKYGTSSVKHDVWKSFHDSNGISIEGGFFVMGIGRYEGEQVIYHLPLEYWDETTFAEIVPYAPKYDGHTSKDLINRLKSL